MSLPEVARYLGMSERTIYMWAQDGRIPAFKLGSAWRFRLSEIDAWLMRHHTGPDESPLTDPVEPRPTEWSLRRQEEETREAHISKCVEIIQRALMNEGRTAITFDRFADE